MKVSFRWITRQYNTGGGLGGIYTAISQSQLYYNVITFTMVAATLYQTAAIETARETIVWLSFPVFLSILAGICLTVPVFHHKIVLPALWRFVNKQQYEHDYPVRVDIEKLSAKLDELTKLVEAK